MERSMRQRSAKSLSREVLISQVQMLARELGRTPTSAEFNADPRVSCVGSVIIYFGSWNQFLEAAGVEVVNIYQSRRKAMQNDELIEQLLMLAKELGRTPSAAQFDRDPRTSSSGIAKLHFGSWNQFLEAAGLQFNRFRKYTDDDLIKQVQDLAKRLGRTPSSKEFEQEPGTANPASVCIHFGSWNQFLEAAGLRLNCPIGCSDDDLIKQVQDLAKRLGRTPLSKEFGNDPQTVSVPTVQKRFGSWNQFLEAAGLRLNRKSR